MDTNTISITDYQMVNKRLARVVVAFTGNMQKEEVRDRIAERFDNLATVVPNSFQLVKANVAVGFLRANKEVRVVTEKEVRASYRTLASNIMMDNRDRSLWEVKEGDGGKYLARHGHEDLSELVSAKVHHRQDIPKVHHIATAAAVAGEFATFVSKTGEVEHGFVLQANATHAKVLPISTRVPEVVANVQITQLSRVPVRKSVHAQIVKAGIISAEEKAKSKEYYEKLYGYDADYLAQVINEIETTTFV